MSDPYWGSIDKGGQAAASALNINFQYAAPKDVSNFLVDYSRLAQAAIAEHPAGIIMVAVAPPFDALIKKAVKAGVPVVVLDTGLTTWQADGGLTFIGEDPTLMGQKAGQLQATAGVKKGLCVNTVPGNVSQEERCAGYKNGLAAGRAAYKLLEIPLADAQSPTTVIQDIKGALVADHAINGIYGLSSQGGSEAVQAVAQLGQTGKIVVGNNDLSTQVLQNVATGKELFALDHQPYLMAYMSVLVAYENAQYGIHPTSPIITGPLAITKANVAQVIQVSSLDPGVRGAS